MVLDVSASSSWTDYMVIATARSTAHAIGLVHEVDAFVSARGIRPVNPHKKVTENGWQLVDCSTVVVHVMLKEQRDFYALEKLWFKAAALDLSENRMGESGAVPQAASRGSATGAAAAPKVRKAQASRPSRRSVPRKGSAEGHSSKSS